MNQHYKKISPETDKEADGKKNYPSALHNNISLWPKIPYLLFTKKNKRSSKI